MKECAKVSKNYISGNIPNELLKELKTLSPPEIASPQDLIKLYFIQFNNPHGAIIDLRSTHFENNTFDPPAFWYQFSSKFRLATIKLYQGFYYENDDVFYQALEELQMTVGLSQLNKQELRDLLYHHFGGDEKLVTFNLSEFNKSFLEIFKFFIKHEIKLPIDFLFLGVYLTTFYLHMEEYLDEKYNVSKIFTTLYPKP